MSVKMKFGSKDIPFVYKGDKLVYPNPIKDGLLLWYDFKGMRNTDATKEVAKDLSGNGNDGTLTNFNFTEESGYKDNTLVFDGVDDSLTIPELELDETAMSVVHDGKLYAYEDDKVFTVGEDGEIIGGGVNLIAKSNVINNSWIGLDGKRVYNSGSQSTVEFIKVFSGETLYLSRVEVEESAIALPNYWRYAWFNDAGELIERDSNSTAVLELQVPATASNLLISWAKGANPSVARHSMDTIYPPSPQDYKTTTLAPTSLTNLQLYNKTLRKNELLHNAENKGLKKLKPGVPVQDGLLLHYDFSHESNNSEYKDKAFDYSGNGNHGTLNNFNFTEESGYESNGLKFDGVDDTIINIDIRGDNISETHTFVVKIKESKRNNFLYAGEELKVDLYYNRIARADVNPSLSIRHNAGYETFYGALVKDGLEHTTYINGVVVDKSILNSVKPSRLMNIGNYVPQGRPSIDLYNVKVYNRALSPEEIAHNYQIEKEKFDITEGDI